MTCQSNRTQIRLQYRHVLLGKHEQQRKNYGEETGDNRCVNEISSTQIQYSRNSSDLTQLE